MTGITTADEPIKIVIEHAGFAYAGQAVGSDNELEILGTVPVRSSPKSPSTAPGFNLIEGFFSKMARSVLRGIRVASKAELKQRILAYLEDLNRDPVIHTWRYTLAQPA